MIGTALKLVKGIGTIATRGAGISNARKFGMGAAVLGYGVTQAAGSDFMAQYFESRYGEEKGQQILSPIKSIGSIAGVGLMGYGAVKTVTGKSHLGTMAKAPMRVVKATGRGAKSLATGTRKLTGEAALVMGAGGLKGGLAVGSMGTTYMAKKAWGGVKGVGGFAKRHPYLGVALPAGLLGGGVAGGYSAHHRNMKRRGAMEGSISSVKGFQYGSMAPSMQFLNTPGMSQRLGKRSGNRIIQ